jgi:hypothetical protein
MKRADLFIISLIFVRFIYALGSSNDTFGDFNIKYQRMAMKAWSETLTDADYNTSVWGRPQDMFDKYAVKLSNTFKNKGLFILLC